MNHAASRLKPSWYAVQRKIELSIRDLQRFMAKRMGAKTIEVTASRLSLISQPRVITDLFWKPLVKRPDPSFVSECEIGAVEKSTRRDIKPTLIRIVNVPLSVARCCWL